MKFQEEYADQQLTRIITSFLTVPNKEKESTVTTLMESMVNQENDEDASDDPSDYDGEPADEDWHFENAMIEERKRLNQEFGQNAERQT